MEVEHKLSFKTPYHKDGLPIGMQIIGKKYEDLKVLAFAKKYEEIFEQSKTKPKLN